MNLEITVAGLTISFFSVMISFMQIRHAEKYLLFRRVICYPGIFYMGGLALSTSGVFKMWFSGLPFTTVGILSVIAYIICVGVMLFLGILFWMVADTTGFSQYLHLNEKPTRITNLVMQTKVIHKKFYLWVLPGFVTVHVMCLIMVMGIIINMMNRISA